MSAGLEGVGMSTSERMCLRVWGCIAKALQIYSRILVESRMFLNYAEAAAACIRTRLATMSSFCCTYEDQSTIPDVCLQPLYAVIGNTAITDLSIGEALDA